MYSGQAFVGSIADYTERRAAMAEPFFNFPIEAVRRWARGQIKYAEEYVPKRRRGRFLAFDAEQAFLCLLLRCIKQGIFPFGTRIRSI